MRTRTSPRCVHTWLVSCWAMAARRHDSASAVGNAHGIVPYAENQQVTMRVNGNALSGEPEEYVAGKLTVVGRGAAVPGGQLLFEITRWPKYGQFGWNNSVSGQFVYSPRSYSMMTSNHGVESTDPVPGCKYSCSSCPNAAGGANFGPSQPEADPDASDVCDGRLTRCNGFRSTLRDTDFPGQERYVPLASDTQVRWVNGHVCAKPSEEDTLEYRRARAEHALHRMDQSTRERVECKDVPPRRCVMHSATIPSDMFAFRVRNQFGVSNTATVTVVFERIDRAAMALQFTVLLGVLMFFATCTGLLRVIVLQLLLHPYHQYKCIPAKLGNMFCPVPPPPYKRAREPNDFKPEFMKELASTWPPPGYEGRREATLQRKKEKQSFQLNQDQSATAQQRGRSLSKRELKAQQADDAMRRSFSRLVSKETRQKGAELSAKQGKKVKMPSLKRKTKRDGLDEKEFDFEDAQSLPPGGPTAAPGNERVSAAMGLLVPMPSTRPAQAEPMASVPTLGGARERDWDAMDDLGALESLEIDNPVANYAASGSYGPGAIGDEV